jgi:NAD(P)-dependent dehydrogenase (short-subunit alcohol dehydrogenase family)
MASFVADKKCCIVVGLGRGGIGDSLAKKFSAEGYNVAMVARSNLQHLEKDIPNSKSYQCDAGDPDQVAKTVAAIQKDTGSDKIDALMYNVGAGVFKPFESTTYEEFELSWKVGPAGVFLWTKACLPSMGAGCSIGLTGATASWRGMPFTPAFASSKMATRGLAQALARDLGPSKGIHVFHVIIDGLVNLDLSKLESMGKTPNQVIHPDNIAETYWQLHQQSATCWTQETHLAAQGAFDSIASI